MAWIVGVGISDIGAPLGRPTEQLLRQAFEQALEDAGGLTCAHVGAFLSCPAVADGQVFMSAHRVATALGILPSAKAPICRSVDAGGATPVLLVGDAMNLVQNVLNRNQVACVLIGDAAASIPLSDLVKLMTSEGKAIPIPLLYDMVAKWHQKTYGTTREQFAMTSSVMSQHASHTGQGNSEPWNF
jgi:acetyl-CoA acetyltransferase